MSWQIIRRIAIKKDGVYVTSAANNCRPLDFSTDKHESWTKILETRGRDALYKDILREYWRGMIQKGANDYTRAVALFRMQYPDVRWDNTGYVLGADEYGHNIKYLYSEVDEMLLECLRQWKRRDKTRKYIIRIFDYGWLVRANDKTTKYVYNRDRATIYKSREAAMVNAERVGRIAKWLIMEVK